MQNAKLSQLKAGDKIETDAGFTCMAENVHTVEANERGELYVKCSHGKHYLSGQIDDERDGDTLVGMFIPE